MKVQILAPLVFVALGVLLAHVEAQACINSLGNARCSTLVSNPGCSRLNVRLGCRRACNVCNSYEIPNPETLTETAVLYGGNHIVTWDRLPFDCTARGELVLVRNDRTGLRIHSLSVQPSGMRTPVTKAVSLRGSGGLPRLQMSINEVGSRGASSPGQCRLNYWVGGRRLTNAQVNQVGGWGGIALNDQFEPYFYKMDARSRVRVTLSLHWAPAQGCYFDRVIVKMQASMRRSTRGLMGTPDNFIYNDWHRTNGALLSFPGLRTQRYFRPAYDYGRNNWCIRGSGGSLINYFNVGGGFFSFMRCNVFYRGLTNFNSATAEMRRVCGAFNWECLHDAVSTGRASAGADTNRLIGEMEIATVLVKGLRVDPRALRAGQATTVTLSVKLPSRTPGLQGFGVWSLNENSLRRVGGPQIILYDNGDIANGDDRSGDNEYTGVLALTLRNGYNAGYEVVPLISGSYRFNNRELTYVLPLANRGYSTSSGVTIPSPGNLRFSLEVVNSVYIEVKYIWPEDQPDLDTGTSFLSRSVGVGCPGSPYIDWTSGDDTSIGGIETANVQIGEAWTAGAWSASTTIFLNAHWFSGRGRGPITVTILARRRGTNRPIANTSLSFATTPGGDSGCAASIASSRVGRLTINRSGARYNFRLIPS